MQSYSLSHWALGLAGALTLAASSVAAKPLTTNGTPKDPGVIQQERILYWAQKRGELAANASAADKAAYLRDYLAHVRASAQRLSPPDLAHRKTQQSPQTKQQRATKAATEKTVKVLTVLIDFPDLPYNNNRLSRTDTSMYYADYNVAHYRDLMFSTTGYVGPNNQNLQSAYQYYQLASGQSLHFTGDVLPWVRADNNAAYYGGNVGEDEDDKAVPDLIKEAVAKAIAANPSFALADYDQEDQYDLDSDGNLNEPDGIIDHVMVFHSSVGEEAGGGVLDDDAIWSHRWSVSASPATAYAIPGTSYKLFGYTIQPIDAATGVVVHEFGHDLGLPDEYDTKRTENGKGEPVGMWSVMSGGSWAGFVRGTEPVDFSPYARDLFQQWYGGNWVHQTVIPLADLQTANQQLDLVEAIDRSGPVNQIRIDIPGVSASAFAGTYLYASGHVDQQRRTLSFPVTVPNSATARLQLQAQWKIEADYDYARVLVNGTAISGTSTRDGINPEHGGISRYLTAESAAGWQLLSFPLTDYQGQSVTITIEYVTDQSVGGYGIVLDAIEVNDGSSAVFSADAEADGQVSLTGFRRDSSVKTTADQNYFVQLRSHRGLDAGLLRERYDHGVVLWFADQNFSDNNVELHPGQGFLGVVDADQVLARSGSTILESKQQVRDAAFRRFVQEEKTDDTHLTAIYSFDDRYDYSSPESPQSGLLLPDHKLVMSVLEQAADSRSARVFLSANPASSALQATTAKTINALTVTFTGTASGGTGTLTYAWEFGDGQRSDAINPSHTYASAGSYTVRFTVTDANGVAKTVTETISVSTGAATGGSTGGGGGGGGGSGSVSGVLLLMLAGARYLRRR